MEPGEVENVNFRYHHHVFRCKSNDQDPFVQASYKRKSLAQCFYASHSLCNANATCQIFEDRALRYHCLVDDRSAKSINNYADAALTVAAGAGKNDTTKWTSNLRRSRPLLTIVNKIMECPGKCASLEVVEEDLKKLANSTTKEVKVEKMPPKKPFIPKTAGIFQHSSFASTKETQRKSSLDIPQQNPNCGEPLTRGKSFEYPVDQEGTSCNAPRLQNQQRNTNATAKGVILQSDSNELGPAECGGFSRRNAPPSNFFSRSSNSFGFRGSGGSANHTRGAGEGPSCNNIGMGSRFMGTGSVGGPQMGGSFGRGFNHNSQSRNSAQTGQRNNHDYEADSGMSSISASIFKSARDELAIQNQKKYGSRGASTSGYSMGRGGAGVQKRSLGTRRGGVRGQFVPPIKPTDEDDFGGMFGVKQPGMEGEVGEEIDERLKNIDPKMVETIRNEIMDIGAPVEWDDIAGLEFAKKTIQEIVVWPLLRPDIFTGLRKPPKGILLFGPPGTGKTLIGKCIASQSQSTFFSISASSLTSKWIGDGEKMVRALFAVAKVHQPSVVFIDEIDSLLTQRSDTEHESSRRIKTEFLVQLDGAGTGDEERILVVGATNRPQELDEAARRRLVKRLYIPLPEFPARRQIVERLMSKERSALSDKEIDEIASLTDGYSGADMKNLCQEASLGPIRSISFSAMHQITADQVRPINIDDFKAALTRVRASVSSKDLEAYVQWDKTYGMGSGM